MAMKPPFEYLPQAEEGMQSTTPTLLPLLTTREDKLHAERLLTVEDKLYKRLARRVATLDTLPESLLNPAKPDGSNGQTADAADGVQGADALEIWCEETFMDFAAFTSNLARVQFLLKSNQVERERYEAKRQRILDTAESVRQQNAELYKELASAQADLEVRKSYDKLAEQITKNTSLRPRDEQYSALDKLRMEMANHESERIDQVRTWSERRDYFSRIMDENASMLRLIHGEKEDSDEQDAQEDDAEGSSAAGRSRTHTPRPETGESTPRPNTGHLPDSGVADGNVSANDAGGASDGSEDGETHDDAPANDSMDLG